MIHSQIIAIFQFCFTKFFGNLGCTSVDLEKKRLKPETVVERVAVCDVSRHLSNQWLVLLENIV